ncbi:MULTISPECIES: tRNA (adenosine(37)-N6)-threonylcarbamoyltransferase complex transferase subunit TsaD [Staphylococcus]|jgi:N6-L-threonylcarbamoyladenine synthase|uniref:tRNA N6-adenosine threonylcarbamoyltransferase n=1 Tax=Staphylococcus shinii TaxID=2912228 RepID=A0A418IE31_9STAP|nr:tRNA (adenosine(37)-N6)-threonylcarbamoyltransferase complex transferase subunit TsaD [Staphylococcus shinii]MBO3066524.1 tRNA (adenosine(37)-N6)-threonylcarbamoyltransferase complex transferase subunit TsaD [Staphylococcus shinii]MDW8565463.1 tRNA (adenosine(37)-N6)-threonylcarbamoyltransferase complex transferase subunit TsaD [Staphylococcus shinii]MDW8568716.1 tRNA (adenosine(37)-N6)-threonylcarbamoyltransferase complex transferase subunit TsaD [Staphylococcus shinii]MDW8571560.1 tRNA (ad
MNEATIILAIESSCDETSVSVIKDGTEILSNIVLSQIESHKRFGGVVPEVASRHHVEGITATIDEALNTADVTMKQVDAVAVTQGPGLIGALLVGINAAKALAFAYDKPLIPVHHIAGHIYANHLEKPLQFPVMSLIVSGGHTELIYMKNHLNFEVIGETRDDAVGEAYDKVARTIGLSYPGGPQVDKLAVQGQDSYDFPRVWLDKDSYDFSFSGLKSAVINKLHNVRQKGLEINEADVATSFQNSVVEVLVGKSIAACEAYNVNQLIVAGGVASNKGLRSALSEACESHNITLSIPSPKLCTDNAAMIGAAAHYLYHAGITADMTLNGVNSLDIEAFTVK